MRIYIEGFDMPKSCGDCPVRRRWAYDSEIQCALRSSVWEEENSGKRNKDCPLMISGERGV